MNRELGNLRMARIGLALAALGAPAETMPAQPLRIQPVFDLDFEIIMAFLTAEVALGHMVNVVAEPERGRFMRAMIVLAEARQLAKRLDWNI